MRSFFRRFSRQPTLDIPVHQVLPAESRLEGHLTFRGGLHIQGIVQGKLTPQGTNTGIVVDRTAQITTEVLEADTVVIGGLVAAQTIRAQRIVLSGTARVTGALEAAEVEIQKGALFEGRVFIQRPQETAEPKASILPKKGSASVARERLQEAVGQKPATAAELS